MRRLLLPLAMLLCGGSPAVAGDRTATGKAYEFALRCFVVDDKPGRGEGRTAYNAAMKLGPIMGKSSKQISSDFNRVIAQEEVKFLNDKPYEEQLARECAQLGLRD